MVRKKNKMFVDSADRTPHYSLRKLSVGVASVLLSTTLWMGANGSVAHADTINNTTVAGKVEDKLDPSETHKDQTQAQNGQAQAAVADANQAENKQAQEGDSANAEAQTANANDAQADVEKQEPAAQSQQTAPQAQVSAPASAKEQASTAEGQTNGSANADAAIDATTEEKKDSANPEANSSDAATEDAKNESTTLDVSQALKTSTVAAVNKKMVTASLANMADSISENNADTTAVPGFSVTDPEYPSEMYRDPDPEHYTFFWGGQTDNGYQTVISTNRNGDGQIHVFELDQSNNVLNSFDLDKNQSSTSWQTGVTYYNDEYAGLVRNDSPWSPSSWTIKYETSGGKSDPQLIIKAISFIVPRLNTQVTSYHDEYGNDITDENGKKIEPVVQQGLDGQKYTTTDTTVIDGYYAIAPSNAQGTMSPYGKIGNTYEKNWHNGYIGEYTQINNAGDMSVQIYGEDQQGNRTPVSEPIIIKPGDNNIYSGVDNIYLRSIYVPQTTDIEYVYKKLGNTVLVDEDNKPFKGNTPTRYPNDPNDPTKAGKVVIPQYEGYTPKINGVPVGPDGFIPTDPGENTRVVYTANPAAALVRFIDNTENRTLDNLELPGKTGETIDFAKANAQLNSYLAHGYKLVANGIPTTETKFDTSDDTKGPSQVFVVKLDHDTVTVTPENPVNPGDKINKNVPDSPTYTPDQATVTEDHTLTVHYVGAPKNPADNLQKSHWTREVTIDKVTGETISSTDWATKDSYVKVGTPEIAGYTPDKSVVDEPPLRTNQEVTVTYTANSAKALVRFIDNTENRTLDNLELPGKTGETIDFAKANAQLNSYLAHGYKLVANGIPTTETKFDTSDDTKGPSQVFVVKLDHDTVTVTPENPVNPGDKINKNVPDSPTYTPDQATVTEDHTLTVHYVGAPKNPADNLQKSHWTREVTIDKVTGETISSTDWATKDSYVKVGTPEIAGYTPDKSVVDEPTLRTNQEVTVTYTANSAKALVRFIDNTENRTLDNLELPGKTGETIDFAKANAQLNSYLAHGYKLVANGIPTTETKFDTSDDTKGPSQVFVVKLDHDTVTVTPENPVNPGDKINKNVPDSPTYTPDQATVTEDHTLTVHYVGAPKNPADNLQKSHWTREVTIDKVTGETISSTDWATKDSYVKVGTPEIAGYTPDKSVVDEPTLRTNQEVTVTYTANSAKALVRFIDNTENRTLDNLELPGKTGETIDFAKANAQLNSYLAHGYKLVANGIPTTETKFDTSDDTKGPSQVFVVKLDHDTVTVTPENPVNPGDKINKNVPDSPTYTPDQATVTEDHTLTVHYVGAPKNPADNLQKSHWTREVTIDKVTGETISSTDWATKDSYVKVGTPEIAGYTPDKSVVDEPTLRTNQEVTVTYTANSAKALVRFIDNTENRTLDNLELPGKTGETIDFAKANAQLNSYLAHGYKLVANGIPTTETKFDTSDDTKGPSQVFVVKLDHDTVTVTPENPVNPGDKINKNVPDSPTYTPDQATVTEDHTLTVHYVGAPKNPADNLQKSHWTREVTIDKVTGETISSTDWATKDSYVKVGTPEIAGYTPDKSVVDEPTLRTNQEVTVTYTANSAKALVRFIDNTENRTLDNLELPGKTGETIDFAKANAQLNSYLAHGYKLVANGIPTTETKFDTSDDTKGPSQVFVVKLDHDTVTVTPENPVNPGDKINKNVPDSPTYTPDQATVTEDHTLTVHYVGAPKNPADNLQKSHWTREVTIDKVTGETISSTDWATKDSYVKVGTPEIAGYTPDKSVVDEPTLRTNQEVTVTYTANSAKALVRFIDNTENRTLDNLELPGKTGETIDFAKANAQLNSYLAHGYKLVANGIPTTETKFDTSDDTKGPSQVFVVKLDHDTVTVTPENPVNPGDKINKNVPDSPTYTPDQATVTEDHTLTVHYVGAPKNPADNLQKSHWTREVTIDKVTGETISSTDWATKDSYVKVGTPEIAGYTPDKSVVDEPTLRTNQEVTVTYTANSAAALVRFIDNTENRTLDNLELPGKTGETIDFGTANAQLKYYLDRGYNLVANGIPTTETKFDTSDDTKGPSQVFVVKLDHDTVTVTPENPVNPGDKINKNVPDSPTYTPDQATVTEDHTLTVHYVGAPKNPADNLQKSHWTREVTIDKVTGETISSTDWATKDSYVKVGTPEIAGYTPDKSVVDEPTLRTNQEVTVTYTANSAKALVRFIDNTENRTLDNLELPGKTGETIDFAKANAQLNSYLAHGYKLVANGIPTTETKFDTSDDTKGPSQVFEVHLDHTMTPGETTVPGKQTVTYVYKDKDGKVVKTKTVEEGTIFTGKTTKDDVTGKTTTTWDQKDHKYTEVTTPVEPGYTADKKSVGGDTVTPDDPNRSYTVVYTPNGSIVPVDPNGNPIPGTHPVPYETDPTDPTKVVDGKVPEVPGWTPKNGAPVKPSDPTKDTEVPYDHTMTPGETTATGKVEGLPEKPAKSAKAPAEKLVETPVKAPKAVKTAEPAKTISIKESAQAQDQLPQTGEDNSKAAFGLGLASILGGIGILGAFKRKKKEN